MRDKSSVFLRNITFSRRPNIMEIPVPDSGWSTTPARSEAICFQSSAARQTRGGKRLEDSGAALSDLSEQQAAVIRTMGFLAA